MTERRSLSGACSNASFLAAIASAAPALADRVAVFSPPGPEDQAGDLVGEIRYATLDLMDRAGLKEGRITGEPWSDSYWPYYQGLLALRYSDPDFPASPDWGINSRYLLGTLGKKSTYGYRIFTCITPPRV